jgi:VIT1/CCC1 family predicted Fe2+/Mn2+ transporter
MAGRTDIEHFASERAREERAREERAREEREVSEVPHRETAEVHDILRSYGLNEADAARVAKSIKADKKRWVDFMMRFELGLEEPDPKRAGRSALTISLAYIAGGLISLTPFAIKKAAEVASPGVGVAALVTWTSLSRCRYPDATKSRTHPQHPPHASPTPRPCNPSPSRFSFFTTP